MDPWPEADSVVAAIAAMEAGGRYEDALAEARAHIVGGYARGPARDSLLAIEGRAWEGSLYERARALPAPLLEQNRGAYADLARRFPNSPRLALYVQKRDDYSRRIADRARQEEERRQREIERESARYDVPAVTAAPRNCCKYCDRGQPCGDSCISRSYTCHKGPGCAC